MNREYEIKKASWIGMAGNALLAAAKVIAGLISGSLAVVADGIDSLSDIFTSLITLVASRILSKPPDIRFPYGYGKADTIATKGLSFIILFAGAQLAITTVRKLIQGTVTELPTKLAIVVTIISIIGKLLLAWHQKKIGRKTSSNMLIANGRNMQNDVLISTSVLTGLFFTFVLKMQVIDSIAALLVSIWIIKVGFEIFMQSNIDLMDGTDDCSIYNEIFTAIEHVEGAHNPHRVRARKIGDKIMVNVDIEVDGNITLQQAHDIAHKIEASIKSRIDNIFDVAVHMEPLGDKTAEKKFGLSKDSLSK
ncbi:MAG TPA: cation diffusion facilitator family transporter [Bacteroidales bacterium]|nr:cation diffusion facilitator family transporter [Bacteroidales bacterium]